MTFFGLSERGAEASRKKYGLNELLYKPSFGKNILRGFGGMSCKLFAVAALAEVIAVLLGLTGFAKTVGSLKAAGYFFAAAVFCGLFEAVLRQRSEKLLNEHDGPDYTVFRENGKTESVPKNMLAVGDAVFLSAGDEIPADGLVAEGTMIVDQSVFGVLGKAEKTVPPQNMHKGGTLGLNNPYFVYGGSIVQSGSGIMKITAVGKDMRIAGKSGVTPVKISAEKFSGILRAGSAVGAAAALAVLAYDFVGGYTLNAAADGFAKGIANAAAVLAVSCLCGKGLLCETAAAKAVKRLSKKGVSILGTETIEKAADVRAVFIERTGIIAETEYSKKSLTFIDGNGKEYNSFKKIDGRLAEIFSNAVMCTSSAVMNSDGTAMGGSPLDRALYGFIGKKAKSAADIKVQAEVKAEAESFLSGATVTVGGKLLTFVRGGAEILLDRCSDSISTGGKRQKITNKSALEKLAVTISLTGKDVVALAVSERGIKGGRLPSEGYALIGLFALYDEFFPNAAEEVKRLEKLGARTVLITEQSRESALFAAKLAEIKKSGGVVLDSEQLAKMDDAELSDKLEDIKAIVRAAPSDRRRLIRAAHAKGIKVCVTASDLKAAKASTEADCLLAAPNCRTAVRTVSDAAANRCGIKAAADMIACSAKYLSDCRTWLIIRIVCTAAAATALILISN